MTNTMNIALLKDELLKLKKNDLIDILINKKVNSNVTVHESVKSYITHLFKHENIEENDTVVTSIVSGKLHN